MNTWLKCVTNVTADGHETADKATATRPTLSFFLRMLLFSGQKLPDEFWVKAQDSTELGDLPQEVWTPLSEDRASSTGSKL